MLTVHLNARCTSLSASALTGTCRQSITGSAAPPNAHLTARADLFKHRPLPDLPPQPLDNPPQHAQHAPAHDALLVKAPPETQLRATRAGPGQVSYGRRCAYAICT